MENKKRKYKRVFMKIVLVLSLLACFFVLSVHSFADSLIQVPNNRVPAQFIPNFHFDAKLDGRNTFAGSSSLSNRFVASLSDVSGSVFYTDSSGVPLRYYSSLTGTLNKSAIATQLKGNDRVGSSLFNYSSTTTVTSTLSYNSDTSSGEWFRLPTFSYDGNFVRLADWDLCCPLIGLHVAGSGTVRNVVYSLDVLRYNYLTEEGESGWHEFASFSVPANISASTPQTFPLLPTRSLLEQFTPDNTRNLWTLLSEYARKGVVCVRGSVSFELAEGPTVGNPSEGSLMRFSSFDVFSYGSTSVDWSSYWSPWFLDNVVVREFPANNNWLDWLVDSVGAFLDAPILGTFSIGSLLLVVLGIATFNLFVHMFRG